MKLRRFSQTGLLFCALVPASYAATITNGSFETFSGAFGADGGAALTAGSSLLPGWTIISQIAVLTTPNSYSLTPSQGTNFLDLTAYSGTGGGSGQGVRQSIGDLIVGSTYRVSFDLGVNNSSCGVFGITCNGPVSVVASVGSLSGQFTHNPTGPGNIWGNYVLDFAATAASMPLTITMVSTAGTYVGLDNVNVAVVPEPSVVVLFGVGLAGMSSWVRRRESRGRVTG